MLNFTPVIWQFKSQVSSQSQNIKTKCNNQSQEVEISSLNSVCMFLNLCATCLKYSVILYLVYFINALLHKNLSLMELIISPLHKHDVN